MFLEQLALSDPRASALRPVPEGHFVDTTVEILFRSVVVSSPDLPVSRDGLERAKKIR